MLFTNTQNQTRAPMKVDMTTKAAGKALSSAGALDEFIFASNGA